jgi:hypothetical protein
MLPEHVPDLSTFSESDLFSLYRAILSELKSRGVIRTENAPVGDYAEYLVAAGLGGQLAPNSEKSWDVLGNDGEKLQVKARVVSDPAGRVFRGPSATRERQNLVCPPGNHGPSRRNGPNCNSSGGTKPPERSGKN